MNLTISKNELVKKINKIKCSVKNTINFFVDSQTLWAEACNGEMQSKVKIAEGINDNFEPVTVPSLILNMIDKLPDKSVLIEFTATKVKIISGTLVSQLNTLDWNDGKMQYNLGTKIRIENLKQIIKKVSIAVSKSNLKPALNGINIKSVNNMLMIRTTDSFRISQYKNEVENLKDFSIIVPCANFLKVMEALDEDYSIYYTNTDLVILTDDSMHAMRLIDEKYPLVEKFMDRDSNFIISLDKNQINAVLDRCSILNDGVNDLIKMSILKNEIIFLKESAIGQAKESINCDHSSDETFNIALSLGYLKSAINTFDNSKISFKVEGNLKPIILASETDEKGSLDNLITNLILPVSVN